jgi:hypothetical protein
LFKGEKLMKYQQKLIAVLILAVGLIVTGCSNDDKRSEDMTDVSKVIITGITVDGNTITLKLDSDDLDFFQVEISYSDGISSTKNTEFGKEQKIVGLGQETSYEISIKAVNSEGNTSVPNTFTVETTDGSTVEFTTIETRSELENMSSGLDGHYLLIADIDLSGTNWTSIGSAVNEFTGTFIGNGLVISNLTINSSFDDQGLFGYVGSSGRIENVGLEKIYVTGNNYIGGLVGSNHGTISRCYATGQVSGVNYCIGGLVGLNEPDSGGGIISRCYAKVAVNGDGTVNGLGGLAGGNFSNGSISQSYATGNVGSGNTTGGFVGINDSSTVTNCYYDKETTGQTDNAGKGGPRSTDEMKSQVTFYSWDFDTVWSIDSEINNGYPYLSELKPE